MKKAVIFLTLISLCIALCGCGEPTVAQAEFDELQLMFDESQAESDRLLSENNELQKVNDSLTSEIEGLTNEVEELKKSLENAENTVASLTEQIEELENGPAALIISIRNAAEGEEWEKVVELAEDLHARANGTEEDIEGQKFYATAIKAIEKAEAERAREEARAYDTGITFDQLSRSPNDYKGQKVKLKGVVFQSFEQGSDSIIMVAVGGNYNNILYVTCSTSSLSSRILENDWITVLGIANGLFTYESSGRGTLSVPWVKADSIER